MSYKTSYFRCLEHRLSTLHEDMDDQEALRTINKEISNEELKSLIQQGNTTSFIFSIKNRIGGLARVLKVFQEHDMNIVHIESRLSHRSNSEYEIYVDLEADRTRVQQSMTALKRQVSCVEFDPNVLLQSNENIDNGQKNSTTKNCTSTNKNENINLPPLSPFLDHNGQAIERQSKLFKKRKLIKIRE